MGMFDVALHAPMNLPFLSDYYNQLVFNGMVLPDDKMKTLWLMFFGESGPKPGGVQRWSLFFAPSSASRGWTSGQPPAREVRVRDVEVKESITGDVVAAEVTFRLYNEGRADSEFVGDIAVPDGVLVSGYWLEVGGQRKAGRIVEKKTAQWVYHMIRGSVLAWCEATAGI